MGWQRVWCLDEGPQMWGGRLGTGSDGIQLRQNKGSGGVLTTAREQRTGQDGKAETARGSGGGEEVPGQNSPYLGNCQTVAVSSPLVS